MATTKLLKKTIRAQHRTRIMNVFTDSVSTPSREHVAHVAGPTRVGTRVAVPHVTDQPAVRTCVLRCPNRPFKFGLAMDIDVEQTCWASHEATCRYVFPFNDTIFFA